MQSTHHHFGSLPGGTHHICAGIDRDVGISGAGSYIHSVRSINIDGAVTVHYADTTRHREYTGRLERVGDYAFHTREFASTVTFLAAASNAGSESKLFEAT